MSGFIKCFSLVSICCICCALQLLACIDEQKILFIISNLSFFGKTLVHRTQAEDSILYLFFLRRNVFYLSILYLAIGYNYFPYFLKYLITQCSQVRNR